MPSEYKVREGEGIAKIALVYGFLPDTLWNHPQNSALKQARQNPEVLLPGDIVYIPDKQLKEVVAACDQRHRFRRKGVRTQFQIQIMDGDTPRSGEPFLIEIDGLRTIQGETDAQGWIRVFLTPRAETGKLTLSRAAEVYRLQFSHVDPVDSVSGAQSRLWNLGFYGGSIDGKWSEPLIAAVKAFQLQSGLQETGEMDAKTQAALKETFGS